MSNSCPDPRVPADLVIPGHRILRELGRGGMASVYQAVQESMARQVALKVMLPSLASIDPSFSERFIREARVVAQLSHPNIIAVYDVGVAGPYHYFSMEFHTGGDLKARIREGMTPKAAFSITRQIASALAFAHSKKYIHRDVKPENVIFRHDGTAILTDFGIAKGNETDIRLTATGAIIGTPHYMSPEQAQGLELDHRSDLYSLGVMFYEMLTGNVPYAGNSALSIGIKHLKEPVPQLPPPLHVYQPFIDKFIAKKASDRFQSGEEIMAAIDAMSLPAQNTLASAPTVITSGSAQATVLTVPVSDPNDKTVATAAPVAAKSRPVAAIAAAVILAVMAVAAFLYLRTPSQPLVPPAPLTATPATPITPDASNTSKIAQLLAEADVATRAGHILEPREQSAVHKYRQVLEIESGNELANRRLHEISQEFLAQAEKAIDSKDFNQAETSLQQAAEVEPFSSNLSAARQTLNEARSKIAAKTTTRKEAERKPAVTAQTQSPAVVAAAPAPIPAASPALNSAQEHEQQLAKLASRIQEMLAPESLTATRAVLASELYAEAAKISPNDARVKSASAQIGEAYLRLATARSDEQNYREADNLINKGLEFSPNNRQLTALQKEVAERQKPKQRTFGGF